MVRWSVGPPVTHFSKSVKIGSIQLNPSKIQEIAQLNWPGRPCFLTFYPVLVTKEGSGLAWHPAAKANKTMMRDCIILILRILKTGDRWSFLNDAERKDEIEGNSPTYILRLCSRRRCRLLDLRLRLRLHDLRLRLRLHLRLRRFHIHLHELHIRRRNFFVVIVIVIVVVIVDGIIFTVVVVLVNIIRVIY